MQIAGLGSKADVLSQFSALFVGVFGFLMGYAGLDQGVMRVYFLGYVFVELFVFLFLSGYRPNPRSLFFFGWVLPFLIAQIPLKTLIFTLPSMSSASYTFFFLVVLLFHVSQLLVFLLVRGGSVAKDFRPELLSKNSRLYSSGSIVVFFLILPLGAYLVAAVASGFSFPILSDDPTSAAKEFWHVPGTATVFSLSQIFIVLVTVRYFSSKSLAKKVSNAEGVLLILGLFVIAVALVSYGKRSPILYSVVSGLVVYTALVKPRVSRVLVAFFLVASFVVLNAFIRAQANFYDFWYGQSFHALESAWMYSMVQPLMYVYEAFANFGLVLESSRSDLFYELREKGKILPAFSVLSVKYGGLHSAGIFMLVFLFYGLLYRFSYKGWALVSYSVIAPGMLFLWTGVLVEKESIFRLLGVVMFLAILLNMAHIGSMRRMRQDVDSGAQHLGPTS